MKTIETMTVAELKVELKKSGIKANGKKAELVAMLQAHNAKLGETIDKETKTEKVLEASKDAKKGKLGKLFWNLKELAEGEKIKGMEFHFWKSNEKLADVNGLTIRLTHEVSDKALERAIVNNLRKALKSQGLELSTMVIRSTGSGCLFVKDK